MPINMTCPSCGKTLAAPDSAAGKRAKCPSCNQIMIVPTPAQPLADFGALPAQPPPPPPGSQSSAAGGESWLDDLGGASPTPSAAVAGPGGEARRPCPECGEMIIAGAAKCRFCGAVFDPRLRSTSRMGRYQTPPPNYLVQAILTTLFCCLPFGIVAIVFASQVNGKAMAGDMQGAISASDSARMWCWIAFGLGLGGSVLYFIVMGLVGAMAH
jgi:predicted RNA-binding Zn-ribbon protein involved in translation (DUF1610 family)